MAETVESVTCKQRVFSHIFDWHYEYTTTCNPFQVLHIIWLWLLWGTIACVFMSGSGCVLLFGDMSLCASLT
jgi:hypothetical protein